MKKYFMIFLMFVAYTIVPISSAYAVETFLGVRGGYFVWEPWLKDLADFFEQMDEGSGVLYGPMANIIFTDDFSLSGSGLFGKQQGTGLAENVQRDDQYMDCKFSFEVLRMDIDTALSYWMTRNFKIFAGYKYWYLETELSLIDYRYNVTSYNLEELNKDKMTIVQKFHGPSAGIGFSLPIGSRGYFIATNLSGIYMRGNFEMKSKLWERWHGITYSTEQDTKTNSDMKMLGVNFEPVIGFYPGEGFPIVNVGVRYQYNRMKFVRLPDDAEMNDDWMTDKIYGFFVGFVYEI